MRLTVALLHKHYPVQNLRWMIKQQWRNRQKMMITDNTEIKAKLLENGIPVYKATEVAADPEIEYEKIDLPEPYAENLIFRKDSLNPNWNEKSIYYFSNKTRLVEGDKQVNILTKTVPYEGLPSSVSCLVDKVRLPDQDDLVQKALAHSYLWDSSTDKLPLDIDVKDLSKIAYRQSGIPIRRRMTNLLYKLIGLCQLAGSEYKESLNRHIISKAKNKLFIDRENSTLCFQMPTDFLMASGTPLKPCANKDEVLQTKDTELQDIYPLKPTIDIHITNIYKKEEFFPLADNKAACNVHTLFNTHGTHFWWFPPQKIARATASCFTLAALQARNKYGPLVDELPDPITVQCVLSDLQTFTFVVYQLNTLNISEKEGIKNQVWVDGPHNLFDEYIKTSGSAGIFKNLYQQYIKHSTFTHYDRNLPDGFFKEIVGYNPVVFSKMLALYLNGLINIDSHHIRSEETGEKIGSVEM